MNWGALSVFEIVQTTIRNHPADCIFAPNAAGNVTAAILAANPKDIGEFVDICEKQLIENEIYCPHEGVDRRHLYPGYSDASPR